MGLWRVLGLLFALYTIAQNVEYIMRACGAMSP